MKTQTDRISEQAYQLLLNKEADRIASRYVMSLIGKDAEKCEQAQLDYASKKLHKMFTSKAKENLASDGIVEKGSRTSHIDKCKDSEIVKKYESVNSQCVEIHFSYETDEVDSDGINKSCIFISKQMMKEVTIGDLKALQEHYPKATIKLVMDNLQKKQVLKDKKAEAKTKAEEKVKA